MELLVFVLNQPEYLDEILEAFLNIGIQGATIIESTGMGRTLCEKVPIFGGISSVIQGCRPSNLTIFTVIRSTKQRDDAVKAIESILGDLTQPNSGFLFTTPVSMALGFAPPLTNNKKS